MGILRGMTDQQNAPDNPEADQATPEARALHGGKAVPERREQPDVIALDGDTMIAATPQPETGTDDESPSIARKR